MSEVSLGIDIGGSGVKYALVDTESGELVSERSRVETPDPATPEAVTGLVAQIIASSDADGTIGIGFPAVVWEGRVFTANNIDDSWIGEDARGAIESASGRRISMVNDADAAGIAESAFGAAKGVSGLVLVITFGTGIGSGAIFNGDLVPNMELGVMELDGHHPAERHFSARVRKEEGLTWEDWGDRVDRFLMHVNDVLNPRLLVFGGGITKHWENFADRLDDSLPVVPAALGNNAGFIGAAVISSRTG